MGSCERPSDYPHSVSSSKVGMRLRINALLESISQTINLRLRQRCGSATETYQSHHTRELQDSEPLARINSHEDIARK